MSSRPGVFFWPGPPAAVRPSPSEQGVRAVRAPSRRPSGERRGKSRRLPVQPSGPSAGRTGQFGSASPGCNHRPDARSRRVPVAAVPPRPEPTASPATGGPAHPGRLRPHGFLSSRRILRPRRRTPRHRCRTRHQTGRQARPGPRALSRHPAPLGRERATRGAVPGILCPFPHRDRPGGGNALSQHRNKESHDNDLVGILADPSSGRFVIQMKNI